jgi:hypothetical protein
VRAAPIHERAARSFAQRATAMETIHASAARQLVQPGLFDRRALRDAENRDRTLVALLHDLKVVGPLAGVELAADLQLVAALLICPEGRPSR